MRSGLLKKITFPDPLTNQLVANLSDAINTLSADDDVFTAPSTVIVTSGKIPPGAATVFYRGAGGAVLTLPVAQAQAVQGNARAAILILGNESSGAVTLMASGADTINGAKSLALAAGALQVVVSDGFNQWMVLAPASILAWITSLTGDVVATGPGAAAATIQANVVTNAKAAQMAAGTIKGNNAGGTANALDLTATQVTAMLNVFTTALKGLVPLSGGGTTNFLRADATWAAPPAPLGLSRIRRSVLTSGTTLAKAAGTTLAIARMWAGGGGGGGAGTGGFSAALGGGGASGGYAEIQTTTIPASWTYAIGAGGAAGANTGGTGGTGGNTTFNDGTTTTTAFGGLGGAGTTGMSGPALGGAGGAAGAVSTNGSPNGSGVPGEGAAMLANSLSASYSGNGGSSSLGGGGLGKWGAAAAGAAATGFGSGGGGALGDGVTGRLGGAGSAGVIILEEWG